MPLPIAGIAAGPAISTPASGARFKDALRATPAHPPQPQASAHGVSAVHRSHALSAPGPTSQVINEVKVAQQRLDRIFQLAQSGRTFTPAELLAMQGQVYRASQEIDLASRIADKGSGGVKQILQTQV